jgi:DNA helicase HerA-like ATPase
MVTLTIGTTDGTDAHLLAERFNRHTFWCGQSGSGKTYALGVVLEQLLIHTRLPILVMDPNADFVGIGQTVEDADEALAVRLTEQPTRVLHSSRDDGQQLRVRFVDLDLRTKAAVLRLDPIVDAAEYNVLLQFERELGAVRDEDLLGTLKASADPARQLLALRIENLGVLEWDLWAFDAETAKDVYATRPRALVMDLGGFDHPDEPLTAALSMLDHLWKHRYERTPVLIVIDEAHNLCPPNPTTPLERALTERIVQIAAEGRKYGLWLLLSTQRPSKIHPNVLSQCDNLALLRMSSPRDLAELGSLFGYAPSDLVERSPLFGRGQGLFAGGFVAQPSLVQMGRRLTREGGRDVPVPLP